MHKRLSFEDTMKYPRTKPCDYCGEASQNGLCDKCDDQLGELNRENYN